MGSCLNVWSSWKSWRILKTTLRPCQQRPSAWNPKKNQTHGCLRICHHHSGRIVLVRVRCTCFCETHVQFFEHLSIWSFTLVTYVYLMYLMRLVRKVESSWPEWSKKCRLAGIGRVSKHSKYLMHSYLYLNKMWKFQPDQRCQPTMPTRTWKLGLVCPIVWVWVI